MNARRKTEAHPIEVVNPGLQDCEAETPGLVTHAPQQVFSMDPVLKPRDVIALGDQRTPAFTSVDKRDATPEARKVNGSKQSGWAGPYD